MTALPHPNQASSAPGPRTCTRVIGACYLAITLCGVLGVNWLDGRLLVEGDNPATVANIVTHGTRFRLGIVSVVIIYASVLAASWALHVVLQRVHAQLSLLALVFRMAEGTVGLATVLTSLTVALLVRPQGPAARLGDTVVAASVGLMLELRTAALDVVLCLIGVGGSLFLHLFWRSRLIPRWLAGWGVFTYLSMLGLALVSLVYPEHPRSPETALYGLGAMFEGVFALWMLVRGIDQERWRQLLGSHD